MSERQTVRVSITMPQRRVLRTGGGRRIPRYNAVGILAVYNIPPSGSRFIWSAASAEPARAIITIIPRPRAYNNATVCILLLLSSSVVNKRPVGRARATSAGFRHGGYLYRGSRAVTVCARDDAADNTKGTTGVL